ncbi:PrgI family protein [Candidatus Daviesbacteria bacterium]|nr:PrgI family protein [Candidatus Daviesbacteria bacterium]
MEPHPIPQNVTSFQFKLVGDMTLKQFIYLASGCVTAYVIFVFFARDYPIVTWPLIIIFTLLGIAFAFLPFGSRPLDHWVRAFLKAVYSPTKRVWQKNKKTYKEEPLFNSRLIMYFSGNIPAPQMQAPVPQQYQRPTPAPPSLSSSELPSKEELQKTVDLARQAQVLQVKIIQNERMLNQIKAEAQKPTAIPIDYSQQVNKILNDLSLLVTQASTIKTQLHSVTQQPTPIPTLAAQPVEKEKVKVVFTAKSKQPQVALTTFPNVVNGIVKDKQNNYLEGTVVVIYDKEGLPVRALKTNKLGQFTGSTPLPNGTYTLELEKDGFVFDVLQIELTGTVLSPLMATAK